MTAIGIVEDHDLFRSVLRMAIERTPDLEVGFDVADGEAALAELVDVVVELVLVDFTLRTETGLDLVAVIRRRFPEVRCLVVSGHRDAGYASRALDVGALGYVLKGDPAELREAIDAALAGDTYVSPSVA